METANKALLIVITGVFLFSVFVVLIDYIGGYIKWKLTNSRGHKKE